MSIFDVIKYPVSHPPTDEQLNALPKKIYNDWVLQIFGSNIGARSVTTTYSMHGIHNSHLVHATNKLRKIIKEYDEHI